MDIHRLTRLYNTNIWFNVSFTYYTFININRSQTSTRCYQCNHGVNSVALHPNQAEIISGDQGGVIRRWDLTVNGSRVEMV